METEPMERETTEGKMPDEFFRDVYAELRTLAERQMRAQRKDHTLQASALVNEVWLRFQNSPQGEIKGREHFLAIAAAAMRQILVDHARRRRAQKRGSGMARASFHESQLLAIPPNIDFLDFDSALARLEKIDARKAKVVELRIYGGLTIEETAALLAVSHMTISTDWRLACAWIAREIERDFTP